MKLSNLQKKEYEILTRIDKFCSEREIKYSLCLGTLLGAVRHKSFIPWDDDIDILMKRNYFDKFDALLNSGQFDDKPYYYQSNKTQKFYPSEMTKVRTKEMRVWEDVAKTQSDYYGPWVDVFPYDNIPDDTKLRVKQFNRVHKYNRILYYFLLIKENKKDKGLKRLFKKSVRIINEILYPLYIFVPYIFNKRHKEMTKYNDINTNDAGNLGYMFHKNFESYSREIIPNNCLNDLIPHLFVDKKFPIPRNYDQVLTHSYGEYMKMPKKEDRTNHNLIYG